MSSYDWMISLLFMPLGYTLSEAVGRDATLIGAAALSAAANLGVLAFSSVRNLERLDPPPGDAVAATESVAA